MENSFAMSVRNSARSLCYHPHTLASVLAQHICCVTQAPSRCVFHAEERETFFTFANLINRKNVCVIETCDRLGFASKTNQRLMRVHLMRQHPFHRNDPVRMLLSCAVDDPHSATPDLFQDFVMTETPV